MRAHVAALLLLASVAGVAGDASAKRSAPQIRFWMDARDVQRPRCSGCARPTWIHIGAYELQLYGPAGYVFERFDIDGDGSIDLKGVSPDGRTVHATLSPGAAEGDHHVVAVYRSKEGTELKAKKLFEVRARPRGPDCMPSPCGQLTRERDPGGHGLSLEAPREPRPVCRLRARGRLRFFSAPGGAVTTGEWPQRFLFTVALKDGERGERAAPADAGPRAPPPTVSCSTGQLAKIDPVAAPPGTRDAFRVEVSTLPPDDPGMRLRGGAHRCTARYSLWQANGRARERAGTVRFRIDPSGHVTVPAPRCPPPPTRDKPQKKGPRAASPPDEAPYLPR